MLILNFFCDPVFVMPSPPFLSYINIISVSDSIDKKVVGNSNAFNICFTYLYEISDFLILIGVLE